MVIDRGKIAFLLIVWAVYLSVGAVGLTVPFFMMILGTILYIL